MFCLLELPSLALVIPVHLVKRFRGDNLLMSVFTPAWTHTTHTTRILLLADLGEAGTALRFPLIELPTAVRHRKFHAALCLYESDIVGALARSLDEPLLLLVPLEFAPLAFLYSTLVSQVKCYVTRLLGEGGAIAE